MGRHDKPQPKLHAECYRQDLLVPNDEAALRQDLKKWMSHCVTSRTINPHTHKRYRRENELVDTNDSVPNLWFSLYRLPAEPVYMENAPARKVPVYAHYKWIRTIKGDWGVKSVTFTLSPYAYVEANFDDLAVDTSLRPLFDQRMDKLSSDLTDGKKLMEDQATRIHEIAKKAFSRPDNPVKPDVVGAARGNPIVLAKMLPGVFIEIARASAAGRVTQVRIQMYKYYVYGLLSGVTSDTGPAASSDVERAFYQLGVDDAKTLDNVQKYQIALAMLMEYAHSPKYYQSRGFEFDFPDDYRAYWNVSAMDEGFRAYMRKHDFLVD